MLGAAQSWCLEGCKDSGLRRMAGLRLKGKEHLRGPLLQLLIGVMGRLV